MVEEDKGPDHAGARRRQRATYREVTKIDGARHDHIGDPLAGVIVAGGGIFAGEEPHGQTPLGPASRADSRVTQALCRGEDRADLPCVNHCRTLNATFTAPWL